jgi:FlaA1/EpsC-like NDP-sugar epimerase
MTIEEACQLVLQAGMMGNGGEVFVFDMGKPVKIADLAKKMIRLSGLIPNVDIDVVYTGLRPGEKLYEELLTDTDKVLPTYHEKIMLARNSVDNSEEVEALIDFLSCFVSANQVNDVVRMLKRMIPEFKSQNSPFESLDKNSK